MIFIKRFGKQLAVGLAIIGTLLTAFSFLLSSHPIYVDIWLDGEGNPVNVQVESPFAANWVLAAGIRLYPNDTVTFRGISIPFDFKLPAKNGQQLVYKPAIPVFIRIGDEEIKFYSGAQTLGEALWENNIFIQSNDALSLPMTTPLDQALSVTLTQSQPVKILVDGNEIVASVSSALVGSALAEAGISLQFLDYSIPEANNLIPTDRTIQVVRVREEIVKEDTTIPFNIERIPDPEMNVGEQQVLQTGENGVRTSTIKIRYEDGKEISRAVISEWISKTSIPQRTAYGGNVVVLTFDSSEGSVDYWLAKEVFITSYRDTGSKTASGEWPVYGAIAVSPEWYSILKGTSIYVPGYGVGTVLDVCPGCVGKPWIDVFIPTDDYVPWSRTETVYFLPPAPAGFTGELP